MVQRDIQTSGNITADRRFNYARELFREREFTQAADLFKQTIEIAPEWAACWFASGEALERSGDLSGAREAFQQVLLLRPDDPFGAGLHLMRLGSESSALHAAYVTNLFDQYAPRFDAHLVHALNYRGPQLMAAQLALIVPPPQRFAHLVDLGCGTGLMAKALEARFDRASGVDLSSQMIIQSEKTGLYSDLHAGDMLEYLHGLPEASADIVLAADVFVYVGDLAALFDETFRILQRGGIFGFTVQRKAGAGFHLGKDLRFAHSQHYLIGCAADTGFKISSIIEACSRQDQGRDVPGLVCFVQK